MGVEGPFAVMSDDQRRELRSTGLLRIPAALALAEVQRLEAALDRVYLQECAAGRGIGRDDAFVDLL